MSALQRLAARVSFIIIDAAHAIRYWTNFTMQRVLGVRVILVRNEEVLLVRHWYAPWAWTLPGGGVKKGEDAEHAAIREIREETGLRINTIDGTLGTYTGRWGTADLVVVYHTKSFSGRLDVSANIEIMTRRWFPLDSLPDQVSPANQKRISAFRRGVRDEVATW